MHMASCIALPTGPSRTIYAYASSSTVKANGEE